MESQTSPPHIFDKIFWPVIKAVWEPFSLKRSHWWHWLPYGQQPSYLLKIPADHNAAPRHSAWHNLIQTNFGWSKVAVTKPKNYFGLYRWGFKSREGAKNKLEVCALILQGPVANLIGPHDMELFAELSPTISRLN